MSEVNNDRTWAVRFARCTARREHRDPLYLCESVRDFRAVSKRALPRVASMYARAVARCYARLDLP